VRGVGLIQLSITGPPRVVSGSTIVQEDAGRVTRARGHTCTLSGSMPLGGPLSPCLEEGG